MALTVDTIETLLKAKTGQYVRDMKAAEAAYDSWYRKVSGGSGDAGAAKVEQSTARNSRAKKKEVSDTETANDRISKSDKAATDKAALAAEKKVEAERRAGIRIRAMVAQSVADRDKEATSAERAADRITRAGSKKLAAEQTRLMSGTSLSAAPGQGPVSAVNYALRDQIDLQQKLNNAVITGDAAAVNGLQDQLRYLSLLNQYKRAGLTDDQAAVAAEQAITDAVQARATAEERARQATLGGTARAQNATRNLGRQFQDIGVGLVGGQGVFLVLAQQIPQVADALTDMAPKAGLAGKAIKALQFFATPTGAIILALASAVAIFGAKAFVAAESVDDLVVKLQKEYKESQASEEAKKRFGDTLEGVTKAINEQKNALDELAKSDKSAAEQANIAAKAKLEQALAIREATSAAAAAARDEADGFALGITGSAGSTIAQINGADQRRIAAEKRAVAAEAALVIARSNVDRTRANLASEQATREAARRSDPAEKVRIDSEAEIKRLRIEATNQIIAANNNLKEQQRISNALVTSIEKVTKARDKDLKKIQEANNKPPVAPGTFRTREQAIGIAGREFQRSGFDVSGNKQFRTTTGHANDADHNRYSIDVNASASPGRSTGGINEANAPAIKAKFDAAALRYQKRGYTVLWNGKVYAANGNGPTRNITGKDKHTDHMHLTAPDTIVGQGSGASTESQIGRDERSDASAAEHAQDNRETFAREITQLDSAILSTKGRREVGIEADFNSAIISAFGDQKERDEGYRKKQRESGIDYAIAIQKSKELRDLQLLEALNKKKLDIARQDFEIDSNSRDRALELQGAELDLVTNRRQRFKIQQDILDAEFENRRLALERNIIEAKANNDLVGQRDAEGKLANLPRQRDIAREGLRRDNRGPLEAYRDGIVEAGEDINEALESIEVRGLQSLDDKLTDTISSVFKLGGAFGEIANQIISDLIRIAVQQAIIKPLTGGGGGLLGSLLGGVLGGPAGAAAGVLQGLVNGSRATGGPVGSGSLYRVNEHGTEGYASFSQPGRIIPLGEMNARSQGRTTIVQQTVQVDARNSVNPEGFARQILSLSGQQARQAAATSYSASQAAVPARLKTFQEFQS